MFASSVKEFLHFSIQVPCNEDKNVFRTVIENHLKKNNINILNVMFLNDYINFVLFKVYEHDMPILLKLIRRYSSNGLRVVS
jgi:hypothetical protein